MENEGNPGEAEEEELIYKLYVGGEYYYCRPYRHCYQAVKSRGEEEGGEIPVSPFSMSYRPPCVVPQSSQCVSIAFLNTHILPKKKILVSGCKEQR